MIYTPYPYQEHASRHIIEHPYCGLFLEMGLGKTVSTLSAVKELIHSGEAKRILIVAPLRVALDTWSTEIEKWDHLSDLTISQVLGSEKKRIAALRAKADLYIINRENVVWLVSFYGGHWPFDTVILDELSSFKNPKAQRFKALRRMRPKMKRVIGLTGTPSPNGLMDLWSQLYLLDLGERLGETVTRYRNKYFKADLKKDHVVYKYGLKQEEDIDLYGRDINKKEIYEKIGDICISMATKDYLQLPGRIEREVKIHLPANILDRYYEFERKSVLELAETTEITALNAAALTNKLLQYANGTIYDQNRIWYQIHDEKLNALEEILDTSTSPVLVFYSFRHDLARIKVRLKHYSPRELKTTADIKAWNRGEIPCLVAHPASAGHGLNLQAGGHTIVWFGPTYSLELEQQANARLDRQGQTKPVIIHRLIAAGTMDEDVLTTLAGKAEGQRALMDAVKARIKKYTNQLKKSA